MIPRKRDIAKRARIAADPDRSEAHLKWVARTYVCAAWKSGNCRGRVRAHHVNLPALYLRKDEYLDADNHGTSNKTSDFETCPFCDGHHADLHDKGIVQFELAHGVKLLAEARKLAKVSPHRPRRESAE